MPSITRSWMPGWEEWPREHRGNFSLTVQPSLRSVHAVAAVPYHWPLGLEALMGGEEVNLTLKASAFFRLEQFFPGPPDTFE